MKLPYESRATKAKLKKACEEIKRLDAILARISFSMYYEDDYDRQEKAKFETYHFTSEDLQNVLLALRDYRDSGDRKGLSRFLR